MLFFSNYGEKRIKNNNEISYFIVKLFSIIKHCDKMEENKFD
ncbi:hypothetical protein LKF24_2245 [Lactococcus lactis subsp. lactis]|nr:hypothetical protein LKF24_2245 [Lactococcus lactis subsp. lactis]